MSMKYIREHYGVPAFRGRIVVYHHDTLGDVRMVIVGSKGQYLRLRPEDPRLTPIIGRRNYHPTWNVTYLERIT
jgi:hypothetical protein